MYYNYPRKYKNHGAKRNSGDLGRFICNELQNGVTIWTNTDDVIAWIILKRSFFGFENDIYLAIVYIVPEGSTYLKYGEFSLLYDQILKVQDGCGILLCGDYNARTSVMPDFNVNFTGSNGDLDHLLPHCDRNSHLKNKILSPDMLARASKNSVTINRHCISLVELYKCAGLLIFNWRQGHDRDIGEFTRDDTTGRSVVDYVIGTIKVFDLVRSFSVLAG